MAEKKSARKFPGIREFLMSEPLYAVVAFDPQSWKEGAALFCGTLKVDGHCPQCGRDATFKRGNKAAYDGRVGIGDARDGFYIVALQCVRNDDHTIHIFLQKDRNAIQKVGQWPSLADIALDELKEYKALLKGKDAAEFHKAIGLAANGVGVGSFVYLRRIFERLITKAFDKNKAANGWKDEDFYRQRMPEKIAQLSAFLPAFLVENRKVYGVLSKGLHELAEEECLAYFAALKMAILVILEQEKERRRKAELEKDLSSAIAEIARTQDSAKAPAADASEEIEIEDYPPTGEDGMVTRAPKPITPIR